MVVPCRTVSIQDTILNVRKIELTFLVFFTVPLSGVDRNTKCCYYVGTQSAVTMQEDKVLAVTTLVDPRCLLRELRHRRASLQQKWDRRVAARKVRMGLRRWEG